MMNALKARVRERRRTPSSPAAGGGAGNNIETSYVTNALVRSLSYDVILFIY